MPSSEVMAQNMNNTHSVHALVRLLKSPTDPPSIPGPHKIEIAWLAWSDTSFRAVNKGEVIGEWVLAQLGQAKKARRERDANSVSDPIADSRYWSLLCGVLTAPPPTIARPIKTWLLPLLSRFQLDTIVTELLALHPSQVLAPARAALTVLWPLAEKKVGVDALGECLHAVFDACTRWERVDDNLSWICSAVVGAYRNALANAGNKKKLCNSFLAAYLSSWLCVVYPSPSLASSLSTKQLQDSIYTAGTDTLFSLDGLKQPLDTLFCALSSTPRTPSPLAILPRLFASFLSATHRHRSALFVTATSTNGGTEEARKKGMEFVGKCWTLIQGSASHQEGFDEERWKSIIGIFETVGKERLFASHSARGTRIAATNSESGEVTLNQARDKAIEVLENAGASPADSEVEQVVLSLQLLDVLVRIEYDFIGSALERVLSTLINIPPSLFHPVITPCSELLVHVLEYHTKTRTVHTHTLALLGSVTPSSPSPALWTPSSLSMASAFPLAFHLPILARVLRTSLTPTQVTPLATAALKAVESAWRTLEDMVRKRERASKKRKVAGCVDRSEHGAEAILPQAQTFSYTSEIAGSVLSNLPSNAYVEDSLGYLWGDVGKLGWSVVWGCLRDRTGMAEEHWVKGGSGKKRGRAVETGLLSTRSLHAVTSAALRFLYDVRVRVSSPLGDYDRLRKSDVETLLNIAQDRAVEPKLVLEIIRTLFWHVWYTRNSGTQEQTEAQPIFSVTLDILTTHISSQSKWSGVSADLSRDNLGLAVLYVLTDRWIDVLDALASTESLEKLVSLLLVKFLDPHDEDTREKTSEAFLQRDHTIVTFHGTLFKLFQNAYFWELHNIRAVFLSSVLSLTAPLASYYFPAAGAESSLPTATARTEITSACNVYRLLYYVPSEYFTRPVRSELVKRAMVGDVQVSAALAYASGQRNEAKRKDRIENDARLRGEPHADELDHGIPAEELTLRLTFVRAFLRRMAQFLNATNHATSLAFVNHLLHPSCMPSPSKALVNITLDLIQLHVVTLLRSQEPEAVTSVSSIITTLISARPFSQPNSLKTWGHVIHSATLKLIERLISDFDPASLPDEVKLSLKTLLEALEDALLPHAQRSMEGDMGLDQLLSSERVDAWSRILSLTRWLGIKSRTVSTSFGLKLATSMCRRGSTELDPITHSSVLGLLFEELWCMPEISHRFHLDTLVSFYAINCGSRISGQIEHTTDATVAQATRKLSVRDFSHLLDILIEGVGGTGLDVGHHEHLIHLGMAVLHDAPQGTLRVVQSFVTQCFSLFVDRKEIYGSSSSLKMQCLELIAKHCSDRPVAIHSVDVGNIWSFLNKMLSGSPEHDPTTAFPIFYHIVTVTGALIRLRRDLVVHALPHLSLVLRQLMLLTRKLRPQLGAKQSKIVTDTFPSWLSASQPISADEARALARLLTSLTTKTVPRTHAHAHPSTSTESQRAESLAKPFAKHATYVLVAYVDAFNDPLCVINAEIRRELEPGLFALCEMVGEHSRDALMASMLDSGGKTIMKSLWKDYEKQRYVGKG